MKYSMLAYFSGVMLLLALIRFAPVNAQIVIGYTTNLNGHLQPCYCEEGELGSMVRLATAVDSLRVIHPGLLLLDSGDFLKSYPMPLANTVMAEFMEMMNYSAIGVGDQELVEGSDFFVNQVFRRAIPLVASNMQFSATSAVNIPKYILIEQNDLKIGIISVIDPAAFDFIDAGELKILPVDKAVTEILKEIKKKADIIVLLYHYGYRQSLELMRKFQEIDIVISGHSQERTETWIGNRLIVQTGYDGEYLGLLEIEQDDQQFEINNRFIPVSKRFSIRKDMQRRVEEFNQMLDSASP